MANQNPVPKDPSWGNDSFRTLQVWKRSFDLALEIIRLTNRFPKPEGNGLTSEIRTSAILLPSYIAGGQARPGSRWFLQNLLQSMRALARLEIQILICAELGYLERDRLLGIEQRILEIRRLAGGLIRKLRSLSTCSTPPTS